MTLLLTHMVVKGSLCKRHSGNEMHNGCIYSCYCQHEITSQQLHFALLYFSRKSKLQGSEYFLALLYLLSHSLLFLNIIKTTHVKYPLNQSGNSLPTHILTQVSLCPQRPHGQLTDGKALPYTDAHLLSLTSLPRENM